MKTTEEIGLTITATQREYFRYTGLSAEVERRGMGCSRPELAWARRYRQEATAEGKPANETPPETSPTPAQEVEMV